MHLSPGPWQNNNEIAFVYGRRFDLAIPAGRPSRPTGPRRRASSLRTRRRRRFQRDRSCRSLFLRRLRSRMQFYRSISTDAISKPVLPWARQPDINRLILGWHLRLRDISSVSHRAARPLDLPHMFEATQNRTLRSTFALEVDYRASSREHLFLASGWGIRDVGGPYVMSSSAMIIIPNWGLSNQYASIISPCSPCQTVLQSTPH